MLDSVDIEPFCCNSHVIILCRIRRHPVSWVLLWSHWWSSQRLNTVLKCKMLQKPVEKSHLTFSVPRFPEMTTYSNQSTLTTAHGTNSIKATAVVKLVFCRFFLLCSITMSRYLKNESANVVVTFLYNQLIQWEQKSHHQCALTTDWERQSVNCGTTKDHWTYDQCVGQETSAHILHVQRNISLFKRVNSTTMTDTCMSKSSFEMSQFHYHDVCPACVFEQMITE